MFLRVPLSNLFNGDFKIIRHSYAQNIHCYIIIVFEFMSTLKLLNFFKYMRSSSDYPLKAHFVINPFKDTCEVY